ncbi:hypothetical protein AAFC00_000906 [Neodothiora populina]|uniref:Uncharacterized protein n=1 Tax=Neodothiora populina TaxID=2781224 RepID=A0ABR3PM47_9PEZI
MSSTMSSAPSFMIYRATSMNGESYDPTASIQFYPPKDSDELFDALRAAYPQSKTHADRMRDAVIDFLLKERNTEQLQSTMASTPSTWSQPSATCSSSTLSSPDLIDLATPVSSTSPLPAMSRQQSKSSTGQSGMEQMTGVFSLSNNSQLKTRTRRKMTETEKAEYRKRRIVKACDKCSKRKRKCQHNQEKMETLASSGKVTKRKSSSNQGASFRQIQHGSAPTFVTNELDPLMSSFLTDDALSLLEVNAEQASTMDSNLDLVDFDINPQNTQNGAWPWSETEDWTLMDEYPWPSPARSEPLFGDQSPRDLEQKRNLQGQGQISGSTDFASMTPQSSSQALQSRRFPSPGLEAYFTVPGNSMLDNESPMTAAGFDLNASTGALLPGRSRRHLGGFDRSAFLGEAQSGVSAQNINTSNVLQSQSLGLEAIARDSTSAGPSRGPREPSASNTMARQGAFTNTQVVAASGQVSAGGSTRGPQDQYGFVISESDARVPGLASVTFHNEEGDMGSAQGHRDGNQATGKGKQVTQSYKRPSSATQAYTIGWICPLLVEECAATIIQAEAENSFRTRSFGQTAVLQNAVSAPLTYRASGENTLAERVRSADMRSRKIAPVPIAVGSRLAVNAKRPMTAPSQGQSTVAASASHSGVRSGVVPSPQPFVPREITGSRPESHMRAGRAQAGLPSASYSAHGGADGNGNITIERPSLQGQLQSARATGVTNAPGVLRHSNLTNHDRVMQGSSSQVQVLGSELVSLPARPRRPREICSSGRNAGSKFALVVTAASGIALADPGANALAGMTRRQLPLEGLSSEEVEALARSLTKALIKDVADKWRRRVDVATAERDGQLTTAGTCTSASAPHTIQSQVLGSYRGDNLNAMRGQQMDRLIQECA